MHRQLFTSLWIMFMAWPGSSQAQESLQANGPRHEAFQTLKDSQWVRVTAPGVGRRQGRLLERSPSELVLSTEAQPIRVPATSIDTLWNRGNSATTGAIVGSILLAGFGVYLGTSINQGESDYDGGKGALGLGLMGAVTGALLGTVIGTAVPKWHRRYP